ncbi:hypothetical protein [Pseudokordiimonas caeni]|uniref:hypothetical protein n=1 Tax=Pseudokordiimonas caeni TaxID=2997908 RepID=UPI0028114777|nr:hypothetical protein [Pseudokordiimonas caeni]
MKQVSPNKQQGIPGTATPDEIAVTVEEAVGVFDHADWLQAALDDLQEHGFMRHELSVLASDKVVEEKLGHIYRRAEDVEDDPQVPRTVFVSDETMGEAEGGLVGLPLYAAAMTATGLVVASGGTLLAALLAATLAGAAGASLGALLANRLARHHADYIEGQIGRGGMVLWVHLRSSERAELAKEILSRNGARDIHTHKIAV